MINVREFQAEMLSEVCAAQFVGRLCDFLASKLSHVSNIKASILREEVRLQIAHANRFNLFEERDVATFVICAAVFGSNFFSNSHIMDVLSKKDARDSVIFMESLLSYLDYQG